MYSRNCLCALVVFLALSYSQAQDLKFGGYWVGTLQLEKMQPAELELQVDGESGLLKLKLFDAGTKTIVRGNAKVQREADSITVTYEGSTESESYSGAVITGSLSGKWAGGDLWEGRTTFEVYESKWRGQFRLKKTDGEITGQLSQVEVSEEALGAFDTSRSLPICFPNK